MMVRERGLGVAKDAAEGNLAIGRLEHGVSVALGALGGLDLELGALEEEAVALQQRAVGVAPGAAANVVNVPRVADGQGEDGGLVVVELFDVARKNVDQVVRDARQDDALHVAALDGEGDLLVEPFGELVVVEVAHGDVGAVGEREGALVGDERPVARRDEGGDGAQVGVCLGGDGVVKVELLLGELLVAAVDELQREGDEEEFWVGGAGRLEDVNGVCGVASEHGPARGHGVHWRRDVGVWLKVDRVGVVGLVVAPAADLEAQLAVVRPLGEDGVEAREASLFAVRADESLPL